MAKPASREELKQYCLRKLGAPVLEINVDDDQLEDLIDDALQYFNERHFNGMEKTYLKHNITADDVVRFKESDDISSTTDPDEAHWETRNNFIEIPEHVIGIEKVFGVSSGFLTNDLFGLSNQYYLMDLFSTTVGGGGSGSNSIGRFDLVNYYMLKQYFETMDMVVNTGSLVNFRFNKRQSRLYIDINVNRIREDSYLVIDCYRALDPQTWTEVYNDSFLKKYTTALIKRQWGQNLIKFNGVQLPGGVSINGRELFEDALRQIDDLESKMISDYEIPPLDAIG